ncbi:MAG: PDZ domain-containing protein [Phycisphaeraceae bacterium]|nr:PDZ domain-containing protein [Phycisphaeraceae bacterium]
MNVNRPIARPSSGVRATRRRTWPLFLLGLLVLWLGAGEVAAQQSARLPADELTAGRRMKQLVRPVAARVGASTLWLTDGRQEVSLATIVGENGLALTKASELPEENLRAKLEGRRTAAVEVLTVDSRYDLALLRIDAENLVPVRWASETSLQVGDWLVSAGPNGEVVSLGVMSVQPRRIAAQPGVMGIEMGEPTSDGVPIGRIFEGSGAEAAGLRAGDLITHINDRAVQSREALGREVRRHGPGDNIDVRYKREGESKEIQVRLSGRVGGMNFSRGDIMNRMGGALSDRAGGFPLALAHDSVLTPSQMGGPLVNLDGDFVGINIARAGRTESLAVPASQIAGIVRQMQRRIENEGDRSLAEDDDESDQLAEGDSAELEETESVKTDVEPEPE